MQTAEHLLAALGQSVHPHSSWLDKSDISTDCYPFTQCRHLCGRVQGAEHLLAALEGMGVDNARIEIEGGFEVPIIDGSSLGWVIEIQKVCHLVL